jgi:acyl carrier protein
MTLHALVAKIVIEAVELEGYTPATLPRDVPLFDSPNGGGLGLDSVASLEIVARLGEHFRLDFDDVTRQDLASVNALVAYIQKRSPEATVG